MKIAFLLGSPGISGGSYVIYEHASRLKRKGHSVAIITRQEVRPEEHAWHSSAAELDWLTLRQAKAECFDVLFATWWETAFLLRKLNAKHCAYFVQSIESRFFDPPNPLNIRNTELLIWRNICEQTYAYALPMITEAQWIQEYLHRRHNNWPYLVRNGIRKDIYTSEGTAIAPRHPGRFRVLVEGPVEVFFKNVSAAVRLAKEAGTDEIWLLTSSAIQSYPDVDRVFSRVPIHETPAVYRSCDLVLKLSHVEGMFGPPLEMFHCGGTALVYDVTGHDEYIVHDQNAYVVKTDDETEVVRLLRHLKENPAALERLKHGAAATAAVWPDWDVCSAQFEQALLEITAGKPTSREYLVRRTMELFKTQKPFARAVAQQAFAAREKAAWENRAVDQNNFLRFSWDSQGQFNDGQSQWRHYLSGEWRTFSFSVQVDVLPLWLLFHLSSRIGMIEIDFLVVRNKTQGRELISFREPDEFQILFLAKDMKWILPQQKNILFIYGTEPILLLPAVNAGDAEIGDVLEIEIRLKETGIQQFAEERRPQIQDKSEKDRSALWLYWDSCGSFTPNHSQRRAYPSREGCIDISFELQSKERSLWLRLDFSSQVCVIEIDSIVVLNTTQGKKIMAFLQPDDFKILFLTGGLTWIASERRNVMLSSGTNPICILPQLKADDADPGDLLELAIKMKESSPQHFFERHRVVLTERAAPRWQRLLQALRQAFD